jgi:hypothetical protein
MAKKRMGDDGLPPELIRELGRLVVNFNSLESTVAYSIWILVSGDPLRQQMGKILVAGRTFLQMLDLLSPLVELKLPSVDRAALGRWVRFAKRANERRNSFVHGDWMYTDPESALVGRSRAPLSGGNFYIRVQIGDVRRAADRCWDLNRRFAVIIRTWGLTLGGTPR